ncbi:metallophosphoesterase [Tissierella sp. MB52-C2]|uniref:metallophosphoesterase family protein n=1 Tax=Tissierella sp. MB52-C2 TaxID=3070999 RepID=UPI00280ABF58|nr:metallophosphoesterase [Tissierella sp. MB52-C2]WMM26548.1 metallophosphoesterase [Tissierella sp. MB52-C2]
MKLLFFTDTHIRGNTPKNRKDIFVDTLEQKLIEINEIIKKNKIDFVLHGGDLFDRPDVSIAVASKFAMILDKIQVPFYLISGNHDIYGHNPDTVNRTMLGLLDALGVVNLVKSGDKIFLQKDNIKIQLTGQPYVYDIDALDKRDYYILKDVDNDVNFSIHMVHGMLLDKPFIKGVPYTLIDDIKDTLADITLCGHYHSGFKTTKIDDKFFINPGSLVRVTNSLREIERIPKVIIIELEEDIKIREIPLQSASPGTDVLDRQEIEKNLFKNERMAEFKQTIDATLDFEKMDINEVLIEVSTAEDVGEEIKVEALRRIALIQMKGLNGD